MPKLRLEGSGGSQNLGSGGDFLRSDRGVRMAGMGELGGGEGVLCHACAAKVRPSS